jgi:sterol desaturase/sphingolipid hydroxylase (fatty acid hydroxylase superfamily)
MMGELLTGPLALLRAPFTPSHPLFVAYVLSAVLLALFVGWRQQRIRGPADALAWLFPREVWRHPSVRVDVKLLLFNALLDPLWLAVGVAATTAVAVGLAEALASVAEGAWVALPWSWATTVVMTLCLLVVTDFANFLNHGLHHKVPFLWRFHAVHHSAEVLTPLTLYRKHPLYDGVKTLIEALVVGVFQGLMVFAFAHKLEVWTLAGINGLFALFLLFGSHLRHSHVWWDWGALDHVLISPALHQLHHSDDPAHEGNYGSIFSVWDGLCGTLVRPQGRPTLRFGLYHRAPAHEGLIDALLRPFRSSPTR